MRVRVAGFITIDVIELKSVNRTLKSIGGPPSYSGLVCARHGNKVEAVTMVGYDFPKEQVKWLEKNGIKIEEWQISSKKKTTSFHIKVDGEKRELRLVSRCASPTQFQASNDSDAVIISPVAGEISNNLVSALSKSTGFTFIDPQGFLRKFDKHGNARLSRPKNTSFLEHANAIKMDLEESMALTGTEDPLQALSKIHSHGIKKCIVTNASKPCFVLDGNRVYRVEVPKTRIVDTTGAGDILTGLVTCSYLRTRDFLWSSCYGIAASSMSLHLLALSKVDAPMGVEEVARMIYSKASYVGGV